MSFVDPPDPFAPDSPLDALSAQAEAAHIEYGKALDEEAEAKENYLRQWHQCYLLADAGGACKSNAQMERWAEAESLDEKVALNYAEATTERYKSLVRTTLARLSAAQSKYRFESGQS